MTFSDFIPQIAGWFGLAPATLMFLIFAVNQGAKVVGRKIPNDATGFWGNVRIACSIIGADPSSVLNSNGDTVQQVAAAAATTPPIDAKVAAENDTPLATQQEKTT